MSDGTSELKNETDSMDTKISDKIDTLLASITGGDGEVVSFVSENNTSVQSVQFVIQTESIELSETEVAVVTWGMILTKRRDSMGVVNMRHLL